MRRMSDSSQCRLHVPAGVRRKERRLYGIGD